MMLLAFVVTMEYVSSSLSIIQNEGRCQERKHGLIGKDMGLVKTEAHRECSKASFKKTVWLAMSFEEKK